MSEGVSYRKAAPGDAESIAGLHAESWRATYRGAYSDAFLDGPVVAERILVWRRRFQEAAPDQLVLVAEEERRLVGFACAYGAEDTRWGTLLDNLHVLPERHGQGIGQRLMREVVAWCRANHPACGLYLWVLDQNRRARSFYERLGAVDAGGEIIVPPGGGEVPCRRYAWASLEEIAIA